MIESIMNVMLLVALGSLTVLLISAVVGIIVCIFGLVKSLFDEDIL
jgi:type III secretory pathway component EscS